MQSILKLTWVELKLFSREPITMVFTLALPIITIFVMGGVFGSTPDPDGYVYRGVSPIDYYTAAYMGLVMASLGVIALPVHLANYRERGILRRFRASAVSPLNIIGGQVIVTFILSILCCVILYLVTFAVYRINQPANLWQFFIAFISSVLCFASLGILLGSIMPNARAAQGIGLLIWFVLLFVSGTGPPLEVLSGGLKVVSDISPLKYVISLMQDPWLGFGWNNTSLFITLGVTAGASLLSIKLFRWE